jgi:intein/homing endonuclease
MHYPDSKVEYYRFDGSGDHFEFLDNYGRWERAYIPLSQKIKDSELIIVAKEEVDEVIHKIKNRNVCLSAEEMDTVKSILVSVLDTEKNKGVLNSNKEYIEFLEPIIAKLTL